ncbi:hypothetical protein Tco_0389158 [Tanacetum coccineum]
MTPSWPPTTDATTTMFTSHDATTSRIHHHHHTIVTISPPPPCLFLHATTAVQPPLRVRWYSSPEMGVFVYVAKPQGCVRVGFQSRRFAMAVIATSRSRKRFGFAEESQQGALFRDSH